MNIADQFQQVVVAIDKDSLVSTLEEMSGSLLAPVDPTGVTKREILHAAGQRDIACLQSKMDMVCHEAEGMDAVAEPACPLLEKEVEAISVVAGKKDRLSAVASENDVIQSATQVYSRFACHGAKISRSFNLSTWKPDPRAILTTFQVSLPFRLSIAFPFVDLESAEND